MNNNIGINPKVNSNSPQFTGKVDSSVTKYVKVLKKEAKDMYVANCKCCKIQVNPVAFRCIDERCDTALEKLNQKAAQLHEDTVIKAEKNPRISGGNLYLCAVNKHLLQEWEQKGAANTVLINKNNLREVHVMGANDYDMYISRFEMLVQQVNPEKLDGKLVRTSVTNLWNLGSGKILKGNYAEKYTNSTQKVALDIGYENKSFADSLRTHFAEVRAQMNPKEKDSKPSILKRITSLFN